MKTGLQSKFPLATVGQRIHSLHEQGRYQESLDICLQITHTHPEISGMWVDAAANCMRLGRWQDAVRYAQTALVRGGHDFGLYDVLAHSCSELGQLDQARRYGLQALDMRDRAFGGQPVIPPPEPEPLPPPPSAQTRERNIIAFSLFGGDSRYCEPAVLNVQEQPDIYPDWVCRFYVDGSVPENVIGRLRSGGGQVVRVAGTVAQWPGPIWRLLALNDPQAHRILFRDADAVISRREAKAVEQWIASGKRFHMVRDSWAHTELMLAGLWGVIAGSLPPLGQLMERFLSGPLESRRFADQDFLRQYVWPYARASLMQHDSVFGFMDAVSLPDKERPHDGFHVGCAEGASLFVQKSDLPDGSEVIWTLYRFKWPDHGQTGEELPDSYPGTMATWLKTSWWGRGQVREEPVCSYPGTVKDGTVTGHIPACYARQIQQGTAVVRLRANGAA
jgi:hypothetical protein